MSKWKIRDAVLDFDWNDYDDTMRFHEAEEALNKEYFRFWVGFH